MRGRGSSSRTGNDNDEDEDKDEDEGLQQEVNDVAAVATAERVSGTHLFSKEDGSSRSELFYTIVNTYKLRGSYILGREGNYMLYHNNL
jgi:hypothetical protein